MSAGPRRRPCKAMATEGSFTEGSRPGIVLPIPTVRLVHFEIDDGQARIAGGGGSSELAVAPAAFQAILRRSTSTTARFLPREWTMVAWQSSSDLTCTRAYTRARTVKNVFASPTPFAP